MPVSGQLSATATRREQPHEAVSCRLSTHRHSLVGPSCARRGVQPPSRSAYRTDARTPTGLSRSTRPRPDREGRSLYPGARCSHDWLLVTSRRRRNHSGSPALSITSHLRGFRSRGINESSLALTRPIFPLPVAPGWSGRPWAFPLMLRTPPLPATHVRVGTGHEH